MCFVANPSSPVQPSCYQCIITVSSESKSLLQNRLAPTSFCSYFDPCFCTSFSKRSNHTTVIYRERILLLAHIHSHAMYELPFGSTPTVFSEASINEPCRFASVITIDYHQQFSAHELFLDSTAVSYVTSFLQRFRLQSRLPGYNPVLLLNWFHVPVHIRLSLRAS